MNSTPAYGLDVDIDGTYQLTHTKQDIAAADTAYAMRVTTHTTITPGEVPAYDVLVEQSHGRELEVDLTSGLQLLKSLQKALETLMVLQPDHEATVEHRKAESLGLGSGDPGPELEPWANAKPVHPAVFADLARRTNIADDAASCTAFHALRNPDATPETLATLHEWFTQSLTKSRAEAER